MFDKIKCNALFRLLAIGGYSNFHPYEIFTEFKSSKPFKSKGGLPGYSGTYCILITNNVMNHTCLKLIN